MADLTEFEREVLAKLLSGAHPVLDVLRRQVHRAAVKDRELTGVGFFTTFDIPADAPRTPGRHAYRLGDVLAHFEPLRHGAGFVLFVRDGVADMLEGYTFDEAWPDEPWPDPRSIKLTYIDDRDHDFAEVGRHFP